MIATDQGAAQLGCRCRVTTPPVGGDPAPVAFAKGKTKAQILAAVKATVFIVG